MNILQSQLSNNVPPGEPIDLFFIQASAPCIKGCGMMHIKDPLVLIEKSSPLTHGSGFPHYE